MRYNSKIQIRVWTDPTAIQHLFKHKNLRGRLARGFMTLLNYEVTFESIPGRKNTAEDALSRNIISQTDLSMKTDSSILITACSI